MSTIANPLENSEYNQPDTSTSIVIEGDEPKETSSTKKYIILGAGALLALVVLNRIKTPTSKVLSQSQQDVLLNAGAGDPGVLTLQPVDKSPLVFTTGNSSMELAQLENIIDGYYSSYEATCARIASKLKTDASVVFDTVAMLFGELPAGKAITVKSLTGYFQVLEIWSSRFDSALSVVSNAVGQILIAQISGLSTANKCTKWVYIRSNEITQTESTAKSAVVTNISKVNNGLLGIIGKTKISTSETMNSSTVSQSFNEKVSFVPHCEQYQLDPIVVMSVLNSSAVSVSLQYDLLSAVLAMAPKPENFLTNVPANTTAANTPSI